MDETPSPPCSPHPLGGHLKRYLRYIDLQGPINLPANTVTGIPRVIDLGCLENIYRRHSGLWAPDFIVTVLYHINQQALKALLDPHIPHFYLGLLTDVNHEHYVTRTGNLVRFGSKPPPEKRPGADYEVRYKIKEDRIWEMQSAKRFGGPEHLPLDDTMWRQEDERACRAYDLEFASHMFIYRAWGLNDYSGPGGFRKIRLSFEGSDKIGDDFGGYERVE